MKYETECVSYLKRALSDDVGTGVTLVNPAPSGNPSRVGDAHRIHPAEAVHFRRMSVFVRWKRAGVKAIEG